MLNHRNLNLNRKIKINLLHSLNDRNIFLKNGHIKLGDLGLSQLILDQNTTLKNKHAGTRQYMSPEILSVENYNHLTDIW